MTCTQAPLPGNATNSALVLLGEEGPSAARIGRTAAAAAFRSVLDEVHPAAEEGTQEPLLLEVPGESGEPTEQSDDESRPHGVVPVAADPARPPAPRLASPVLSDATLSLDARLDTAKPAEAEGEARESQPSLPTHSASASLGARSLGSAHGVETGAFNVADGLAKAFLPRSAVPVEASTAATYPASALGTPVESQRTSAHLRATASPLDTWITTAKTRVPSVPLGPETSAWAREDPQDDASTKAVMAKMSRRPTAAFADPVLMQPRASAYASAVAPRLATTLVPVETSRSGSAVVRETAFAIRLVPPADEATIIAKQSETASGGGSQTRRSETDTPSRMQAQTPQQTVGPNQPVMSAQPAGALANRLEMVKADKPPVPAESPDTTRTEGKHQNSRPAEPLTFTRTDSTEQPAKKGAAPEQLLQSVNRGTGSSATALASHGEFKTLGPDSSSRQQGPPRSPLAAESEAAQPPEQARVRSSEPVRDISLQLTGSKKDNVEVRVLDRSGEVRVAVRTPDTDLAQGLRERLGDLVARLEDKGYQTEAWRPRESGSSTNSEDDARNPQEGDSGQSRGDARDRKQHQEQQQPRWVAEMAEVLGTGPLDRSKTR